MLYSKFKEKFEQTELKKELENICFIDNLNYEWSLLRIFNYIYIGTGILYVEFENIVDTWQEKYK